MVKQPPFRTSLRRKAPPSSKRNSIRFIAIEIETIRISFPVPFTIFPDFHTTINNVNVLVATVKRKRNAECENVRNEVPASVAWLEQFPITFCPRCSCFFRFDLPRILGSSILWKGRRTTNLVLPFSKTTKHSGTREGHKLDETKDQRKRLPRRRGPEERRRTGFPRSGNFATPRRSRPPDTSIGSMPIGEASMPVRP